VCARRRADLEALRELHAEEMEAVTRENGVLKAALLEHLEAEEIEELIPPSGERMLTAASVADVEDQVASALMLGLQAELASVKAQADALALVAAAGAYTRY
jgi:riboflavin biosynthesis pyrimidine reductase